MFVVFVLGVGAWIVVSQNHKPVGSTNSTPTSSSATQVLPVSVVPNFSRGSAPQYLTPIKNASTGVTVSFKPLQTDAPNSAARIYIGQKQIGQIGGVDISADGFSPNNNYLAMTWIGVSGADRRDYGVNVIDLQKDVVISLSPKIQAAPYTSSQYKSIDLDLYIDSIAWSGDHSLDISSYYLWPDFNDASQTIAYYRVSPEETWRYDLATGSSTLISTIP